MSTKVIGVSMPSNLSDDIDIIAKHLSVSKSAVVSALLCENVPMYARICEDRPPLERSSSMRFVPSSQGEILRMLNQLSVGMEVTQRDLFEK
jgi:hypothetical protein